MKTFLRVVIAGTTGLGIGLAYGKYVLQPIFRKIGLY